MHEREERLASNASCILYCSRALDLHKVQTPHTTALLLFLVSVAFSPQLSPPRQTYNPKHTLQVPLFLRPDISRSPSLVILDALENLPDEFPFARPLFISRGR